MSDDRRVEIQMNGGGVTILGPNDHVVHHEERFGLHRRIIFRTDSELNVDMIISVWKIYNV